MAPDMNVDADTGSARHQDLAVFLHLAARGDVDAFMQFYDRTCATAYRAARAICADRECARRLACSLYVRAWAQVTEYPHSGLSHMAWLPFGTTQPGLAAAGGAGVWARGA
jgi:hypothetical protein